MSTGTQPGQSLTLAVDCGSTNFKAAVFDSTLARLTETSVAVPYSRRTTREVELDPAALRDLFDRLVDETLAGISLSLSEIGTVSLTSQAQTFTVLGPDGSPRTPFISWLDTRATSEAAEQSAALGAVFHQHVSWPAPAPEQQLVQLLWLSRHVPGALDAGTRIVPLPSFLASPWTGRILTDNNLAAMHCLYSMKTNDWWSDALETLGVGASQLPDLIDVGRPVSPPEPGCPRTVFAGNDQTAGGFGNCCEQGPILVTLGTALVAYRFAGSRPGPYSDSSCWGPYPHGGFYEMAVRNEGCLALDWARERLMPGVPPDEFDRAAEQARHHSQAVAPFFYPGRVRTGSPWSATADVPAAAFAALEGIGFCLRDLLFDELGRSPEDTLHAIGGGSRSRTWLQIIADLTGCRIRRGCGDSLLGAARMACPGASPPTAVEELVFEPDPGKTAECQVRYAAWKQGAHA